MVTRKKHEPLWHKSESGLFVPAGRHSQLTQSSSQTVLQVKDKAHAVERLYAENELPLPATCDLAHLISDAKAVSDAWFLSKLDGLPMIKVFRAAILDRVAGAILPLAEVPDRAKYLKALTAGSLDLLQRERSTAKDTIWEIELWSILRRRSLNATLRDPPDIEVLFEDARIGIACKKLYSEKHVQNVLSQGVRQIEATFDFGIIAVNLDDLTPAETVLRLPTEENAVRQINNLNVAFLHRHDRHFRKYLASGRLLSALVSTGVVADLHRERTRLNIVRQSTVWTIPGLPDNKQKQLTRFYNSFMG